MRRLLTLDRGRFGLRDDRERDRILVLRVREPEVQQAYREYVKANGIEAGLAARMDALKLEWKQRCRDAIIDAGYPADSSLETRAR